MVPMTQEQIVQMRWNGLLSHLDFFEGIKK